MTFPNDFAEELCEALVVSGVNQYRSRLVGQFVAQCYGILLSAHHALIEPIRWRQFCKKRGATTKRRRSKAVASNNISEPAITADLSLEAQRLLEQGGNTDTVVPGTDTVVPGSDIAWVTPDTTSPSEVSTGTSSKRPDLVFYPANPALRLQFAMEAKIIRQAADIANDLLGEDGFGCFVRAIDPYENNGVVGLLGYVEPSLASTMAIETQRCMQQQDDRFRNVTSKEFLVNMQGERHQPLMILGHIVNAQPKVCVAHMLSIKLTTA